MKFSMDIMKIESGYVEMRDKEGQVMGVDRVNFNYKIHFQK